MTTEKNLKGEIDRLWNDVHERKVDQEALKQKFEDIEKQFNHIKTVLKDCAQKGFQEIHRL